MKFTFITFLTITISLSGCDDSEIKRDLKMSNAASFPYEIDGLKSRWYYCEQCWKDKTCKPNDVNQCNNVTLTDRAEALNLAMSSPNIEAVYFLIDIAKTDVNSVPNGNNYTPLMKAAYYGSQRHQEIARHMILLGANINAVADSRPNNTALLIAIWKNNIDFAKFLIENGAIADMSPLTGKKERSACEAAIVYGRTEIIPFINGCCASVLSNAKLMPETVAICKN